ncbi:MAG: nitroreductase family protein [Actinobacteria bacterium]|jgi:nitroreductase|nr:MAG: nitroreductase family protein [Actinomycetota bacterium]
MDVEKAIRERRSVRKYAGEKVSEKEISAILEAARWAPSGLDNQPWRVVIVEDRSKAGELAACTRYSAIVTGAPLLLAVFLDLEASYDRDKDIMAIGAFIQNALLAVHSRGLGAVWLGEILKSKERVREILGVPEGNELMAVVAVGKPAETPQDGTRKPVADILINRF